MKKYHYIDDQGNVIDPLPVAALQKIGLPPATKVLIEGGKQWITLAEATTGDPAVAPPSPAPAPPSLKPPTSTTTAFFLIVSFLSLIVFGWFLFVKPKNSIQGGASSTTVCRTCNGTRIAALTCGSCNGSGIQNKGQWDQNYCTACGGVRNSPNIDFNLPNGGAGSRGSGKIVRSCPDCSR
jgi:hypothetical protein